MVCDDKMRIQARKNDFESVCVGGGGGGISRSVGTSDLLFQEKKKKVEEKKIKGGRGAHPSDLLFLRSWKYGS